MSRLWGAIKTAQEYLRLKNIENNFTVQFSKISMLTNAVMAIWKIGMGTYTSFLFLWVSGLYNIGICLAKAVAVMGYSNSKKPLDERRSSEYRRREYRYYCLIGIIIFATSLIYTVSCIREIVGESEAVQYSLLVVIMLAAVTVGEFIVFISGVRSARRDREPIMEAIRLTSVVSAIVTLVLTLKAALPYAGLGTGTSGVYEAIGIFFGAVSSIIGIYMIIRMFRVIRGIADRYALRKAGRIIKRLFPDAEYEIVDYVDNGPNARYILFNNDENDERFVCIKAEIEKRMYLDVKCAEKQSGI